MKGWALVGGLVSSLAFGAAEPHDFSRYQVILDRAPFSTVGAGSAAPQPNFATRYAFVGLVTTLNDNQVLAMIQDKQTNRTHFKAVGETVDGIKVARIEQSPPKLVLQQGLEQATLAYEQRPVTQATPPGATVQPGEVAVPGSPTPMPLPSAPRRIPFRRGG